MGTIFEQINQLPILDVLDSLSIWYKNKWANIFLLKDDWSVDTSFWVSVKLNIIKDFWKTGIEWPIVDFIGWYCLGFTKTDMQTNMWRANVAKFCIDKWLVQAPNNTKTEFKKSLKDKELLEQYHDFKLNWYKQEISAFLLTRWVNYDFIQKNSLLIWEIFKDIGFYDNYYCTETKDPNEKPKTTQVFLFPCYNELKEIIGIKLRRKDWKTIRWQKSIAVGKTGLLYNEIDKDLMYIVEGEMDSIIMQLLWYKNTVANEWWVQALRKPLKSLLAETSKIICLYDNDIAGKKWKQTLEDTFKRPVYEIEYPVRESQEWKKLTDINDLYEVGYDTKAKWDKIFQKATQIWKEKQEEHKTDFIFLRRTLEYYDRKHSLIQQTWPVAAYLWSTIKELAEKVRSWYIKQYEDLCYWEGWKPNHYNTMNEEVIVKSGWDEEPIIHPHIEELINNICNHKKVNIEWLHQAILYKITHINDVYLPAVILYGAWKSWKWTFLNLLSKIFGKDNTLIWLWQRDLEWNFDSYTGNKLIVEYKEIASGNKFEDKKVLDRLKWVIWESRITVNAKHQKVREVDNIAWFQLSSNHPVPIQLDSKHSWNRRFTVIKTWWALEWRMAEEMNRVTFENPKTIKQYVNWLYETYPDVPKYTTMEALDNAEKRDLENNCEWVANLFFEWFEKKYPNVWKITNKEKNLLLNMYIHENWEDPLDKRFKQTNFDMWLSHRYEKKKIRVRGTSTRWYFINKTSFDHEHILTESIWEFTETELNSLTHTYGQIEL